MGSSVSQLAKNQGVKVVIIGAGYAGVHCATTLKSHGIEFVIINEKEYFHHIVAEPRTVVSSSKEKRGYEMGFVSLGTVRIYRFSSE